MIHDLQAEAVLTVKGNQPILFADPATYFAGLLAHVQQAETLNHHRGRGEVCSTEMNQEMKPLSMQSNIGR